MESFPGAKFITGAGGGSGLIYRSRPVRAALRRLLLVRKLIPVLIAANEQPVARTPAIAPFRIVEAHVCPLRENAFFISLSVLYFDRASRQLGERPVTGGCYRYGAMFKGFTKGGV
jgi:hypothetical protein